MKRKVKPHAKDYRRGPGLFGKHRGVFRWSTATREEGDDAMEKKREPKSLGDLFGPADDEIIFDGTGVAPLDVTLEDPPTGAYEVEIEECRPLHNARTGKKSFRFDVRLVGDSPSRGVRTTVFIGTDFTKPFNAAHVANLCIGIGMPAEALHGLVKLKAQNFVGRRAFIYVREPRENEVDEDTGRPARGNRNFITREIYDRVRRSMRP
jgi:hypothetical protein